jgi:phosphoribosylformylglycinamidine cyclo-ligase
MAARLLSKAWAVPAIFQLIQQRGNVAQDEMYRVFNMGIGMALVCSPENVSRITKALPEAKIIGEVVKQAGKARVVID